MLRVPGLLAPSSHNGPLVSAPRGSFPWLRLAPPGEASYRLPGRAACSSGLRLQPRGGGGELARRDQLLRCAPLRGEPASRTSGAAVRYPSVPGSLLRASRSVPPWLMPLVTSPSASREGLPKPSGRQFDPPVWQRVPALRGSPARGDAEGRLWACCPLTRAEVPPANAGWGASLEYKRQPSL